MGKRLFDCTGKVTMVTGGNSGIGLGFAMGPAKMGGDVAIWARNAEKSAKAKEQLLAAGARRVETYQVDVTSEKAVIEGYEQLMTDFGRIDCVFANSGRTSKSRSFLAMELAEPDGAIAGALHRASQVPCRFCDLGRWLQGHGSSGDRVSGKWQAAGYSPLHHAGPQAF